MKPTIDETARDPASKRAPGTCDRHADVGTVGVPAPFLALPPEVNKHWPTFRVCEECAHDLSCPFRGNHGYQILRLAPGVQ